jgi:ABC-type transporter Mla subunit MlaD
MTRQPSNTREALIAELLGDVQSVLDRLDAVKAELVASEQSAAKTAQAVNDATDRYPTQVDETVQRLRTETATIITQTTEHAAHSLVGQQTAALQKAAPQAIGNAITPELPRRIKRDWVMTAITSASIGAVVACLTLISLARFLTTF